MTEGHRTEDVAGRYRRLSAAFAARIAAVPPDRWECPSPCEGWSARDVARHVVESQGRFLGLVGREVSPRPDAADDPAGAWDTARAAVQAALDDPATAAGEFSGRFGRTTFAEAVDRWVNFDLVVHGWDLARATGQDDRIEPEDARRVIEVGRSFGDALRGDEVCGPELDPPAGADDQARMLAFLGRRP